MCRNDGVNHVIAQCVNHVSLDKIAAPTDTLIGGTIQPHRLLFGTLHGDESSPLHCVVLFIHRGCYMGCWGGYGGVWGGSAFPMGKAFGGMQE